MASRLSSGLDKIPGVTITYPTEINEVFVVFPDVVDDAMSDEGHIYYPWITPQDPVEGRMRRLVCSFSTTPEEVGRVYCRCQRVCTVSRMDLNQFYNILIAIALVFVASCGKNEPEVPQVVGPFKIGAIADSQYADKGPSKDRLYRQSPEKLREAVGILNEHDLAFVVHLGDFIDEKWESFCGDERYSI